MKKIIKILVVFILSTPLLWWLGILIWWIPWMSSELPWYNLTETYKKIWNYSIWKQKWFNNICHDDKWCLNWEILWIYQETENIYIYVRINYWNLTIVDKNNIESVFFDYDLYNNTDRIRVNSLNDLPKFWYFDDNKLKFYSQNNLVNLSEEQRKIFEELEENPIIKIDGKKY